MPDHLKLLFLQGPKYLFMSWFECPVSPYLTTTNLRLSHGALLRGVADGSRNKFDPEVLPCFCILW